MISPTCMVRVVSACVAGFQVTGGVARVTVPASGVNAIPFVTFSSDLETWTEPAGQRAEMVDSWRMVVIAPAPCARGFYRAWYRVCPVE